MSTDPLRRMVDCCNAIAYHDQIDENISSKWTQERPRPIVAGDRCTVPSADMDVGGKRTQRFGFLVVYHFHLLGVSFLICPASYTCNGMQCMPRCSLNQSNCYNGSVISIV
jgi:hypothetical protein